MVTSPSSKAPQVVAASFIGGMLVSHRIILVLVCIAGVLSSPAHAQSDKAPRRPKLEQGMDTNSASAYYSLGIQSVSVRPKLAADAFYWAMRLDPANTMAYSARRVALLKVDENVLWRYITGDRPTRRRKDILRIDSLELISRAREPFLVRRFDVELLRPFVQNWADVPADAAVEFTAWLKFLEGDFAGAAREYAVALKRNRGAYGYHNMRALALYNLTQYDSAAAELRLYLDALRKDDKNKKRTVVVYESKAMTEYMIGLLEARQGKVAEARESFGRALLEDLSFAMAHVRLADASLALHDTATALAEYALAAETGGQDAMIRIGYGRLLLEAKRPAEAVVQFRKAIEAEPWYADGYLFLGQALDADGKGEDAAKAYADFARHAALADNRRDWVRERLAQAGSSGTR